MFYWVISLAIIIFSAVNKIYLGYPLTIVVIIFSIAVLRKGVSPKKLLSFLKQGTGKGVIVSKVFILIAANTSVWMSSGCIATLLYYSVNAINPSLFLPCCFFICSIFALLIGSAFATAATVGVIVYIIGTAAGASPAIVAGAIISGIYVGDRASPVSSSVLLMSTLSETGHRDTFQMALKSMIIPYILTLLCYLPFSLMQSLDLTALAQLNTLKESFKISFWMLIPIIVLLAAAIFKFKIKTCLLLSIIVSIPLTLFVQGFEISKTIGYIFNGFTLSPQDPLYNIVRGGGIIPMLKTIYILLASCSLAAIIQEGGILSDTIVNYLSKPANGVVIYIKTCLVALLTTMIGSNQTVSIVMTSQLMATGYQSSKLSNMHKVRDISFSSELLSVIPPWSLTVIVPLASIGHIGYDYMPFMFFIFIAPIYNLIVRIIQHKKENNSIV